MRINATLRAGGRGSRPGSPQLEELDRGAVDTVGEVAQALRLQLLHPGQSFQGVGRSRAHRRLDPRRGIGAEGILPAHIWRPPGEGDYAHRYSIIGDGLDELASGLQLDIDDRIGKAGIRPATPEGIQRGRGHVHRYDDVGATVLTRGELGPAWRARGAGQLDGADEQDAQPQGERASRRFLVCRSSGAAHCKARGSVASSPKRLHARGPESLVLHTDRAPARDRSGGFSQGLEQRPPTCRRRRGGASRVERLRDSQRERATTCAGHPWAPDVPTEECSPNGQQPPSGWALGAAVSPASSR